MREWGVCVLQETHYLTSSEAYVHHRWKLLELESAYELACQQQLNKDTHVKLLPKVRKQPQDW